MRNDRLKWLREMREARFEGKGEAVTKPPVTSLQLGLQLVEVESHHEDYAKPLGQQRLKDGRGADGENAVSEYCRHFCSGRSLTVGFGR